MTATSFQGKLVVWEASVFYVGCLFPVSSSVQWQQWKLLTLGLLTTH